jgi:uncharacterized protein YjbI with pentapeptide repeats
MNRFHRPFLIAYYLVEMVEGKDTRPAGQETALAKRPPWWRRFWGWTEFGEKSGWKYLQLLGTLSIPLVIALGTLWFTTQQNEQQRDIEERRAQAERELEKQRTQDALLQAYLDQMSTLLLEKNLREAERDSEVNSLARARTLTALERLDSERKGALMQFLSEAGLINDLVETVPKGGVPPMSLSDANLREADLADNVSLNRAFLSGANLRGANLRGGILEQSTLSYADLRDANLTEAHAQFVDWYGANMEGADLGGADLSGAYKHNSDGSRRMVTNEELEEQAASLAGATMPDGQKYEDWLKSKGRGEDGKNSGPS